MRLETMGTFASTRALGCNNKSGHICERGHGDLDRHQTFRSQQLTATYNRKEGGRYEQ
jgi:hypothetical protein